MTGDVSLKVLSQVGDAAPKVAGPSCATISSGDAEGDAEVLLFGGKSSDGLVAGMWRLTQSGA